MNALSPAARDIRPAGLSDWRVRRDTELLFHLVQFWRVFNTNFHNPYHVNFLICRRCFWCASKLDASRELTETCPMCDNDDDSIESLPVPDSTISEILTTNTLSEL